MKKWSGGWRTLHNALLAGYGLRCAMDGERGYSYWVYPLLKAHECQRVPKHIVMALVNRHVLFGLSTKLESASGLPHIDYVHPISAIHALGEAVGDVAQQVAAAYQPVFDAVYGKCSVDLVDADKSDQ